MSFKKAAILPVFEPLCTDEVKVIDAEQYLLTLFIKIVLQNWQWQALKLPPASILLN